jgi:hypothetical protein
MRPASGNAGGGDPSRLAGADGDPERSQKASRSSGRGARGGGWAGLGAAGGAEDGRGAASLSRTNRLDRSEVLGTACDGRAAPEGELGAAGAAPDAGAGTAASTCPRMLSGSFACDAPAGAAFGDAFCARTSCSRASCARRAASVSRSATGRISGGSPCRASSVRERSRDEMNRRVANQAKPTAAPLMANRRTGSGTVHPDAVVRQAQPRRGAELLPARPLDVAIREPSASQSTASNRLA